MKWFKHHWSKRLSVVGATMIIWLVLLFVDAETAVALAPYEYALLACYCGFESWKPSEKF